MVTLPTNERKQIVNGMHFTADRFGSFMVGGSLHKYFNEGDNSTDFYYTNLFEAVYNLCEEFKINPLSSRISKVEAGVNLEVDNVDEILDSILLYKSNIGNFDDIGRRFIFSDYDLKIYRKKANIIRIEVKIKKKRFLKSNKVYLNTLDELLLEDVQVALKDLVIKTLESVTIVYLSDEKIKRLNNTDMVKYLKYSNPLYWAKLSRQDKRKFRRERSNCQKFIQSFGGIDLKTILINKTREKSMSLLNFSELNIDRIMSKNSENEISKSVVLQSIDNNGHSDSFNHANIWTLNVQDTANNTMIKIPLLYNLNEMIENSTKTPVAI